MVAMPKTITDWNMRMPTRALQGRARQQVGRDQRAGSGRGAQQAQAHRSDAQDVAGEDGQQRRGAAQQHGEQVQRNGAQQRRDCCARSARRRTANAACGAPALDMRAFMGTAPLNRPAAARTPRSAHRRAPGEIAYMNPPSAGPLMVANCMRAAGKRRALLQQRSGHHVRQHGRARGALEGRGGAEYAPRR